MSTALITGASRGLGRALALALADRGWSLIIDARDAEALSSVVRRLQAAGALRVAALAGSVRDPAHRAALIDAVHEAGGLDLLVNNASALGPSPLPLVGSYPLAAWQEVYDVNVTAPLSLTQSLLTDLRAVGGVIVNLSSDAAVEPYPGWGGYGSSKAALDHWTAVLAVEEPALHVYSLDPGDMRTQMHQDAFPGEDISDRPEPESVVPALLWLVDVRPPSARYRATDIAASAEPVRS